MANTVLVADAVEKDLRRVPKHDVEAVKAAIESLADDPRPLGVKSLPGPLKGKLRFRVGDFRIIYTVNDQIVTVHVLTVSQRGDVYR